MESLKETRQRMQQANRQRASSLATQQRFQAGQLSQNELRDTIIQNFQALANYLENRTSKTEVVNQLKEVGTPDALKVVKAVEELHKTLKTHENTDLTGVTSLLQKLLKQAEAIPKDKVDINIPDKVAVTNQKDYTASFQSLETAVKAIQLVAEAPVVNIPAPEVTVAPTEIDLKPIDKGLKTLEKAVKSITIPETNTTDIEKLLKKTNKLLGDILDKPVGGGGGGSTRVSPYETTNGAPSFVTLENGALPMTERPAAKKITVSGSYTYIATASPGTAQAAAAWQVQRIDESVAGTTVITWADGDANYDNIASNLTSLSYN